MVAGIAALSICESLLLALNDARILPENEIMGILEDTALAHENAVGSAADTDIETHTAVAVLINSIIASGNSVRRS